MTLNVSTKISSGISYVDHLLGFLKTGDNVIWEVEAGTYVEIFLQRFVEHHLKNQYKVVYVSFNISPATLTKRLNYLPSLENLTILDCFTSGKGNNDPLFSQFYGKEKEGFRGSVVRVENPKDLSQFRASLDRIETTETILVPAKDDGELAVSGVVPHSQELRPPCGIVAADRTIYVLPENRVIVLCGVGE